jgi:hypothetical protein
LEIEAIKPTITEVQQWYAPDRLKQAQDIIHCLVESEIVQWMQLAVQLRQETDITGIDFGLDLGLSFTSLV